MALSIVNCLKSVNVDEADTERLIDRYVAADVTNCTNAIIGVLRGIFPWNSQHLLSDS